MAEKRPGAHLKPEAQGRAFRLGQGTKKKEQKPSRAAETTPPSRKESSAPHTEQPAPATPLFVEEKKTPSGAELLEKRRKRRKKEFRSLLLRLVLYVVVIYVLFFHIVGVTIMPGGDMSPRLEAGDLVVYYRLGRDLHSQDVVVLEKAVDAERASAFGGAVAAAAVNGTKPSAVNKIAAAVRAFDRSVKTLLHRSQPATPGEIYVSRIVAAPGDTVEITEGERVLVNGNTLVESNIFYSTPEYVGFVEYPLTLGDGEYFVLSDHRQGAADSRFFGPVSEDEILGVVITVARRNNL